jgi:hypothetical protein
MSKLKRLDTPEGRFYVYEESDEPIFMPSVTTVLSQVASDKLKKLEESMGKEALNRLGMNAAHRGTVMHAFLENYLICLKNTDDRDKSLLYSQKKTPNDFTDSTEINKDHITKGRDLFYNFVYEGLLDRIKKVIGTEKFTWSLKHKFAGTTDFIYQNHNNSVIVTDFKSASSIKDEETITKYELQLAAYTISFEEIYNIPVDHAELWISHPLGIQEVVLSGDDMIKRKAEFIQLANQYHQTYNVHETALKYYKTA